MTSAAQTSFNAPANPLFTVIHQDGDLLVLSKPAGLACHPTKAGPLSSLISRVRLHLPANPNPHLINRLDRETSGLVLVAQNDVTARALRKIWETRQVRKEYVAIVHGHPAWDSISLDGPLGKDETSEVAIKDCVRPDGAAAKTVVELVRKFERNNAPFALVKVTPETGRKHQIRIHLAHAGHPIVGDKIYGGDPGIYLSFVKSEMTEEQRRKMILTNHALHAGLISFNWTGREVRFETSPEPEFQEFLSGS